VGDGCGCLGVCWVRVGERNFSGEASHRCPDGPRGLSGWGAQVKALRVRVVAGEPQASLARELGVSRQILCQYLRPPEPTPF
jgi:hypothetical protein